MTYRYDVEYYTKRLQRPQAADPLAEAEAALKALRQKPDDKQAADTLEKALNRLKEGRAKPEGQTAYPAKP
jgi:hypothetical protein